MPSFVKKSALCEAVRFDGSAESGLTCARFAGAAASLSIDGEQAVLRLARRTVPAGYWLVRRAAVSMMSAEEFAEAYVPLEAPRAAPASGPAPAFAPRGDIAEGDKVIDVTDPEQNELDVLEVEGASALVDGPWGEKTIPLANLRKVA